MTGGDDESLFLGLDASTQALKASLVDSLLLVVDEVEVRFDSDLPHYHTRGGTLPSGAADGQVHSPVAMLVEAFDVLFDRIKHASWPVDRIVSISAAGQQHASVYWSRSAGQALGSANDPSKKLSEQITATAFSRQTVPSWQDSSTLAECEALEAQFPGGAQGLIQATGSKAHARFTGPQIMRFCRLNPRAYEETSRISLVSSFVTTLLCLDGEVKPVDESDACGMNMWDIQSQQWSKDALSIISAGQPAELESKLGSVELDAARPVGKISRWLQLRYGFDKSCIVCSATGDNPATFLSFTLNQAEALVSLGTSDTLLVSTNQYCPHGEYHAFAHPAQSPGRERRYFNMLVYKSTCLQHDRGRRGVAYLCRFRWLLGPRICSRQALPVVLGRIQSVHHRPMFPERRRYKDRLLVAEARNHRAYILLRLQRSHLTYIITYLLFIPLYLSLFPFFFFSACSTSPFAAHECERNIQVRVEDIMPDLSKSR